MALELKKDSKWWYGRFMAHGKKRFQNLNVEVKGTRPPTLRQQGDVAFEKSRAKAEVALKQFQEDVRRQKSSEELVQKIHEIRTGERVDSLPLAELFSAWKKIERRKPLSAKYERNAEIIFERFETFLRGHHKTVKTVADVQSKMARAFLRNEEERGVAPKTYNNILIMIRSAFGKLQTEAGIAKNPFEGLPTKEEDTIFREPFSPEELSLIDEACQDDEFIRPIIITGMCTAMRRGDCCLLQKDSVDIKEKFITVKTAKTAATVQIPIFPLLEQEITKALKTKSKSKDVFAEQAEMYRVNPDGITYRVKKILTKAGFSDDAEDKQLHKQRENGLRKASVRDFHSFRVTWVTLALTSGIPMEVVKKVTGHKTVDIVLKHYFQPGRDEFRKTLNQKMPLLLQNGLDEQEGEKKLLEQIQTHLDSMNGKNWKKKRETLLSILTKATC